MNSRRFDDAEEVSAFAKKSSKYYSLWAVVTGPIRRLTVSRTESRYAGKQGPWQSVSCRLTYNAWQEVNNRLPAMAYAMFPPIFGLGKLRGTHHSIRHMSIQ